MCHDSQFYHKKKYHLWVLEHSKTGGVVIVILIEKTALWKKQKAQQWCANEIWRTNVCEEHKIRVVNRCSCFFPEKYPVQFVCEYSSTLCSVEDKSESNCCNSAKQCLASSEQQVYGRPNQKFCHDKCHDHVSHQHHCHDCCTTARFWVWNTIVIIVTTCCDTVRLVVINVTITLIASRDNDRDTVVTCVVAELLIWSAIQVMSSWSVSPASNFWHFLYYSVHAWIGSTECTQWESAHLLWSLSQLVVIYSQSHWSQVVTMEYSWEQCNIQGGVVDKCWEGKRWRSVESGKDEWWWCWKL